MIREMGGVRFVLHIPELSIFPGETVAFMGESGCGKSTLLDVLGLVSKPDSAEEFNFSAPGSRTVNLSTACDETCAALRRQHFGYVLQSGGLLPFLSVFENVALPLRINGKSVEDARELLKDVGLADQSAKKPAYLSGGQRQRVAVARALCHLPSVVLADEPTGAVDKFMARELILLLLGCAKKRGAAVLIVTHDEQLICGLTDRVFHFEVSRVSPQETVSVLKEVSWAT